MENEKQESLWEVGKQGQVSKCDPLGKARTLFFNGNAIALLGHDGNIYVTAKITSLL